MMISGNLGESSELILRVSPTSIRIETCSLCQLKCVLCPRARGETEEVIGRGYLKFDDFKDFIDHNRQIRKVELGNFGEVFLNPELPRILRYAFEQGVVTEIDEGVNLNDATEEALEALVKYQTARVRCAIDGVTQKTYERYRVGGKLRKVIRNIERINALKTKYQSSKPHLIFQFVVFGQNEHEMEGAVLLARMLRMEMSFKLNFYANALAVQNPDRVRRFLGYADRIEYLEREHRHYMRHQCYEMWLRPQINWDGKLLGCSRNMWGVFAGNVFEEDLLSCINNEKMRYAREMLMGRKPPRQDMPCMRCGVFRSMVEYDNWITKSELQEQTKERNGRADE
jgi:MoaA/NifB/PqqE/SkfB family radical SAM enzyme